MKNQTTKIVLEYKPKIELSIRRITETEWQEYGRPPFFKRLIFHSENPHQRKSDQEKLYIAKRAHQESRKNTVPHREGVENIIRDFMGNNLPKWGSFKFHGAKI